MHIHPVVRFAAQVTTALGGAALTNAVLGTTVVVTTSYLTVLIAYLVWLLLVALGAYAGYRAATAVCDKLSTTACEGYGNKVGDGINAVRNLFSRKATA